MKGRIGKAGDITSTQRLGLFANGCVSTLEKDYFAGVVGEFSCNRDTRWSSAHNAQIGSHGCAERYGASVNNHRSRFLSPRSLKGERQPSLSRVARDQL
jgi:hypothetical protein